MRSEEKRRIDARHRQFCASLHPGDSFTLEEMVNYIWPDLSEAEAREFA